MKKIVLKRKHIITIVVLLLLIGSLIYYKGVYKRVPAKTLDGYVVDMAYDNNVLVIMSDKSLWTWGELGASFRTFAKKRSSSKPTKILDNVEYATSIYTTSYAIDTDGTLWSWGNINIVKDGEGKMIENKYHDEPIPIMQNVAMIKPDFTGTLVLKKDGTLWGWGGEFGGEFLRVSPDYDRVNVRGFVFEPIKISENVKDFYFEHTICTIDKDNNLYRNVYKNNISSFEYVTDNVKTVTVSGEDITILKHDDTLWMLGISFNHWKLEGAEEQPKLVLENVAKIDSRAEGLALKKDGTLWAWGLNLQFGLKTEAEPTQVLEGVKDLLPQNRLYVVLDDDMLYLCEGIYLSPPENIYESLIPLISNVNTSVKGASLGEYTGGYDLFATNDGKLYGFGRGGVCFMINDPKSKVVYHEPVVLVEPKEK